MDLDVSEFPVLVVDDDPTIRELLRRILRRLGFERVNEAADGDEATKYVTSVCPAVVFCDLHMKPVDGLTFLARMRYSDVKALKNLPVVMLTSDMRDEAMEMARTLKATDYIVKPATRAEVKAAVEKALGIELGGD